MALIDKYREPTTSELRVFGVVLPAVFGVIGIVAYRIGLSTTAAGIWSLGGLLAVLYYTVPGARYVIFRAWLTAAYPIGWLISHVLLAIIYYAVITPIGLALRLGAHDLLQLKIEPSKPTYWLAQDSPKGARRYFRQY